MIRGRQTRKWAGTRAFAVVAATSVVALALLAAPPSAVTDAGAAAAPGTPECWNPGVRARPGVTRVLKVHCSNVTRAEVLTQPAHGEVSAVSSDVTFVHFTIRPDEDAPRSDAVVLRLTGPEHSIDLRVPVEVIPLSENRPPRCDTLSVSQRSDGTAPVVVAVAPDCSDPDGDEFVVEGGGPGAHPDAPKRIGADEGLMYWRYRTATHAGTETTTLWGTDFLGARSAAAPITVTVGPGIDRAPVCRTAPYSSGYGVNLFSRPGVPRRFGMLCEDEDNDAFALSLSQLPRRGALDFLHVTRMETEGPWAGQRWIDARYSPSDVSPEQDAFTLTAAPVNAAERNIRFTISPRMPPANGGADCSARGERLWPGQVGQIWIWCHDDEGDAFSAAVVGGADHGTAGVPELYTERYGDPQLTVAYEGDPGYVGYDYLDIAVTDGHGYSDVLRVDIELLAPYVHPPRRDPTPPPSSPETPVAEGASVQPDGPGVPAVAAASDADVRAAARAALATPAVRRVSAPGRAQVYAASRLSRRALLRRGRLPGVFVFCAEACRVRSDFELRTAARAAGRTRSVLAVSRGHGRAVWVGLGTRDRAWLRRARKPHVRFRLGFGPNGGLRRAVRIPIGG